MRPLTLEKPKPLIEVAGMPIIDHIVSALPEEIDELVIVVSYKAAMLRAHCGENFYGRPVTYVTQENPKAGTGDALFAARGVLRNRFLVMYGDDIHGAPAIKEAVGHEHAFLAAYSETPEKFGVIELNADGTLKRIVEKPSNPPSNLVNIGGFVLTDDIFNCTSERSAVGEYYLTDNITLYAERHPVQVIRQDHWIPIGYPEDVEKAERLLIERV